MEVLREFLPLVIGGSLFALIFAVGLDATLEDLSYVLRRPRLLGAAVLSVNVIVPVAAGILVTLVPIAPIAKAGILLMAVSPVPPFLPAKERKAGIDRAYAYGLYAALALLSVATVPIAVMLASRVYGVEASISVAAVARTIALQVLLPLALGLGARRLAPALASRAAPWMAKLSIALLLICVVPVVAKAWPEMMALIGDGSVLVIVLVVAIGLLSGHLLGGPSPGGRAALAMASATRHPGIALLIANANFAHHGVSAAVLLFLLVAVIAAVPYGVWLKRSAAAGGPATTP